MGKKFNNPLDNISIASPCSANWEEMHGSERKRFCGECRLNVYNLSGMTKYDAENILRVSEGLLCVRYFQRSDGTVLTADCPVGWAKVKQRLSAFATAAFSIMLTLIGGMMAVSFFRKHGEAFRWITLPFTKSTPEPLMGRIAMPSPSPSPSPRTELERKRDLRNSRGQRSSGRGSVK